MVKDVLELLRKYRLTFLQELKMDSIFGSGDRAMQDPEEEAEEIFLFLFIKKRMIFLNAKGITLFWNIPLLCLKLC
jgi:hypothetical protein